MTRRVRGEGVPYQDDTRLWAAADPLASSRMTMAIGCRRCPWDRSGTGRGGIDANPLAAIRGYGILPLIDMGFPETDNNSESHDTDCPAESPRRTRAA